MAPLSASLAGKPHPPKSAVNGKQTSSLKGIHVDTCHFQLPGSKPQKSKGCAINPVFSSSLSLKLLANMQFKCSADQHDIWTLTWRGNTSLLEWIRSALWINRKAAIYFPNSLNINLPWVEQNWAICQPPVHHASLILSLFSVVCICVFISTFAHTEHTGTSGQDVDESVSDDNWLSGTGDNDYGWTRHILLSSWKIGVCTSAQWVHPQQSRRVTACCRLCPLVAKVLWILSNSFVVFM